MVGISNTALVKLDRVDVGAVLWQERGGYAVFEFEPSFLKRGLDISPIHMPIHEALRGDGIFQFPNLAKESFAGLPGMLADALPDKFGNALINDWLMRQGRDIASFNPIERLCYIGTRSMGALEFYPTAATNDLNKTVDVDVSAMVSLAQSVMARHAQLETKIGLHDKDNNNAIMDIIRVGTSAGGARPKAIIAMNERGDIRSGQAVAPNGYDYWLLKLDGVNDIELGASQSYGRIEYAYYLMASAAKINMTESRLLEEGGRAHFLTKRFDRKNGKKVHMQSLCGIAHYDFNMTGAYSYENAFMIMRKLKLSKCDAEQQYRRMVFNVIARNQDDHTKNIAFLMTTKGTWKLSPAYDVTYSHNPKGAWTNSHQMSIAGKRDHFTKQDLINVGKSISLTQPGLIVDEVLDVVRQWSNFANKAGVELAVSRTIGEAHRKI